METWEELDRDGHPVLMAEEPDPAPVELTPLEERRRADAIRHAAREFETSYTAQDLRERFKGSTSRDLDDSELADIASEVREQQLDDLVDILDQLRRGRKRGRRFVRIQAPKGYVRKVLYSLQKDEYQQLKQRLTAIGWSEDDLKTGLAGRLQPNKIGELDPATVG